MRDPLTFRSTRTLESGMSMIELMIAMVVLAVGLGALSSLFVLASGANNKNSRGTSAALLTNMARSATFSTKFVVSR